MSKSLTLLFFAALVAVASVGCDKKSEGAGAGGGAAKAADGAKPSEDFDKLIDEYCACKDKACVDLYESQKLSGEVLTKLNADQMKKMGDCAFKLPTK